MDADSWNVVSGGGLRPTIHFENGSVSNRGPDAVTTAPDLYENRIHTACMQRPESSVLSLLACLLDGTFFLWSRTVVPLSGAIFLSYGNSQFSGCLFIHLPSHPEIIGFLEITNGLLGLAVHRSVDRTGI